MKQIFIDDPLELEQIRQLFAGCLEREVIPSIYTGVADPSVSTLVQPKAVTFSPLAHTEMIEDIVTETIRCMQPYMTTRSRSCPSERCVDSFVVTVDFSKFPTFNRNRRKIETFLNDLSQVRFSYTWVQKGFVDREGKNVPDRRFTYDGSLFIGYLKVHGGYCYAIDVNRKALPYLTFIGKGMGYTEFDYQVYCELKSKYVKRLYKLICEWSNYGPEYIISIEELMRRLSIPDNYDTNKISGRIFEPLKGWLVELGSSVQFDYRFVYVADGKEETRTGRNGYNTIIFNIHSVKKLRGSGERAMLSSLRNCLLGICDKEKRDVVDEAVGVIKEAGQVDFILSKFRYYTHKMNKGLIDSAKLRNVMLKVVRESCGIELRSSSHVARSNRSSSRRS